MPFLPSLERNGKSLGEEVPVTTTPIFEGHLSVRTDRKHWQWRLFRFDGSNFTCLSSRKVKLPPNTNQNEEITATSSSSYSLTSPLLATPKDKNKRLVEGNKTELKYYQLPEWTIDVVNISSISVLKRAKKNNTTISSKCFSIRTFHGQCFILKAHKQKDLERWLFVLTKMWKFTQAVKEQVVQQQQQYYYNNTQQQQQQQKAQAQQQARIMAQQQVVEDNIPLVHSIQPQQQSVNNTTYDSKYRSPILSTEKIRVIEEWQKSLAELMASDPCIKVSSPPPIEPIPDDDTMSVFTDITSVSNRPKSISRRRAGSNNINNPKRSNTATSRSLKRNKTNSIAPASQHHQEMPLEGRPSPTLRKKRSDDVRNWMNNSNSNHNGKSTTMGRTASIGSNRKPMIQKLNGEIAPLSISTTPPNNYYSNLYQQHQKLCYNNNNSSSVSTSPEIIHHNMNFFQDVLTVCDDETCNNHHNSNNNNINESNNTLRYHTSVRGKKLIQINQGEEYNNNNNSDDNNINKNTTVEERRNDTTNNNSQNNKSTPSLPLAIITQQAVSATISPPQIKKEVKQQKEEERDNIFNSSSYQDNLQQQRPTKTITRRASMPLTDDNLMQQQQYQYRYQVLLDQQHINSLQSPLQFLSMKKEEEEEDMSLADLQKSLRQVGLHNRSPSASSIHDLQKRQSLLYYNNNPIIVAPAIPPHQYQPPQLQQFQHHHQYMFDTAANSSNYHYDQKKFNGSSNNVTVSTAAAAITDSNSKKVAAFMNHDILNDHNTNSDYLYR